MEQQTLKRLTQARGRLKATVTRLVNYIENPPPQSTYSGVDAILARLNQAFRSLEKITDEMHVYDNVEGFEDPTEDFQAYEEKYLRALTLFASLKSDLQPSAIPQADHNMAILLQQQSEFLQRLSENGASTLATPPPAAVCLTENPLPKIHIKPFGGDYKEWPAFKDIYESTVHNKTHLGKIQKFHYLKSFIVGEAANLLSHMSITESAYDSAWERLNDRYDRPRHIVNSLLDTFMALAAAPNGEVSNLRKLTDGANEIIRGLDAVGETSRDCWVIHLVLAKIDPDSRRKWIEDTRGSATPTVADLFRFLDDRCEDFELSQATSAIKLDPGSHTDKPAKAKRALIAVNRGNCVAPADTAQASPQTSGCSSTLVAQTQNSSSLTQSPGLKRSTLPTALVILVSGISSVKAETTRGLATLHIKSMVSLQTIVVAAHVLGKITSSLQRDDINEKALRIYDGLQLADTSFNTSSSVDILLGNEQIWSVLSGDKKYDTAGNIIAISSIFGWIITSVAMPHPSTANTLMTTVDINASLQRFWEIEDNTEHTQRDPSHAKVEQYFLTTHSRDPDGKYIVELPFKHECQEFGDSLQGAVSRFYAVERRLQRDLELRKQYSKFMNEYLSLGHMRKLAPEECNTSAKTFYMPHHPVLGKKLRVVFDGSFEDVNGHALNDALHIGPSIQRNLFHVCLRFRMHKFVFSADIVKMFRQIWVAPQHRNFQRIPQKIVLEDFYVDDVLTGAETEDELLSCRDELIQLMSKAKLELGKWVSNSSVTSHTRQDELQITSAVKVLGMLWNPQDDVLSYKASLSTEPDATKRQFKILFQELWLLDLDWDSKLPPKLAEWWQTCRDDINYITNLRIPRYVHNESEKIELHGFSDASIKAYSAVVYSRVSNADGTCLVSLMAAKTRVAPLKQQSLPRLELCGALLLTRLLRAVKEGLHHKDIVVHAWCDSTIILDVIPRSAWHHVGSKDNPADCASRGMLAANLMSYELWWNGPHWLHLNDLLASKLRSGNNPTTILDTPIMDGLKSSSLSSRVEPEPEASPIECLSFRVSSWTKLIRCTAYVLRFMHRRMKKRIPSNLTLTFEEISEARIYCLRHAQGSFSSDLHLLQRGKAVVNSSTLRTLSPMVCKNGLLRVCGRLSNSLLPEEVKHPIILPKHHRISLLILEHEHRIHLHPGVTALFFIVRQQYWIVGARNMIRKLTHACLKCFRQRHKTTDQYMADLPAVRVRQAYPFENTGCDYAGPLLLKVHKGRNPRKEKGYICLFVCLVTSAIHLELATDLSTETFLAALRRFVSRRGKCTHIFSDNGRNFVGAKKVLDEMYKLILSQQHNTQVTQALASEGIRWSFIPTHAPHWGGKWESAVRSVKLHLRRVIGNSILTFEQMHTLLAQIESVVNSRPLFATSDIEVSYLSPAHLLIGRPYTSVPEGDLGHIAVNRLDYWQNVQAMLQGFWKRWHQEYLTTLQQRPKWNTERKNIATGDMAIIKDSNTPPAAWTLARIIEVYPGKDGLVRAVKLRTSSGELVRPISKIAILPNSET
ncbi:uncharacterized protein LOC123038140 [Drosophila rhopaloa]|uniref:Integrase catalytic domain-containing protein n=1 Tax=Drosophila rhopaloa TaxID=1041015 RepID=A0ABM5JG77_DRORH|nr:uncharacterized protein LOC123038140 [Drosophila rhopaloa]